MTRTIVASVIGLCLLGGTVFAEEIRGVLKAFDKDAKTLTITVGEKDKEYQIADDAKIVRGKREIEVSKLKKGIPEKRLGKVKVTLTVEDDKVTLIKFGGGKKKKDGDQ